MHKHNLTAEMVIRGPSTPEETVSLCNSVFDIASQAHGHLGKAKHLIEIGIASNAIHAFFPAVRSGIYLKTLQKENFDPFASALHDRSSSILSYQMQLLGSKFTSKL